MVCKRNEAGRRANRANQHCCEGVHKRIGIGLLRRRRRLRRSGLRLRRALRGPDCRRPFSGLTDPPAEPPGSASQRKRPARSPQPWRPRHGQTCLKAWWAIKLGHRPHSIPGRLARGLRRGPDGRQWRVARERRLTRVRGRGGGTAICGEPVGSETTGAGWNEGLRRHWWRGRRRGGRRVSRRRERLPSGRSGRRLRLAGYRWLQVSAARLGLLGEA